MEKEKITIEYIVLSLLMEGFEKIDSVLFTYTLGSFFEDEENRKKYYFNEQEFNEPFKEYVSFEGGNFKLKDGLSLTSILYEEEGYEVMVYRRLLRQKFSVSVLESIRNLDFEEIVSKKAKAFNMEDISQVNKSFFCPKEIEILKNMNYNSRKVLEK